MRQITDIQYSLGETPIAEITFNLATRDDIPQILRGLQHIYVTPKLRDIVFTLLFSLIPQGIDTNNGRPGMNLWNAFVLAILRHNLNIDYDRVTELANEHATLRKMLGHGFIDQDKKYCRQTVQDNLKLFTVEVLDKINQAVVEAGHAVLCKTNTPLNGRCDSFVVETDIHYPTDISLLLDAMRKVMEACGRAYKQFGISVLQQYKQHYECLRNLYKQALKQKSSRAQDKSRIALKEEKIKLAHQAFIDRAEYFLKYADEVVVALTERPGSVLLGGEIKDFSAHARRQIDQIRRRVILGEVIPHEEKVFSLFEPYTQWISKGKAGVPVELGLKVCIIEDQLGFVLHHQVMTQVENNAVITDDKVAVSMVRETHERFPNLRLCSFDKGFWSPVNRTQLSEVLEKVVLPKKGRLSERDRIRETDDEFIRARKQHSAVESAINALEVHGLDRCLDHGLEGFKRYVAVVIVGRNIQKLGATLIQKEKDCKTKKRQLRQSERQAA